MNPSITRGSWPNGFESDHLFVQDVGLLRDTVAYPTAEAPAETRKSLHVGGGLTDDLPNASPYRRVPALEYAEGPLRREGSRENFDEKGGLFSTFTI